MRRRYQCCDALWTRDLDSEAADAQRYAWHAAGVRSAHWAHPTFDLVKFVHALEQPTIRDTALFIST